MSRRLLPAKDTFALGMSLSTSPILDAHWPSDLALMKQIGLQTLEFETHWAEVIPKGRGTYIQKVLDRFDRTVDLLLEKGIVPRIDLGRGELPDPLANKGGWTSRDAIYWFADYARLMSENLGDRVKNWVTHSDPESERIDQGIKGWKCVHHTLLSHAYAREAITAEHPGQDVGFGLKFWPIFPASDRTRDHEAMLRFEAAHQGNYLDLLYHGRFNDIALQLAKASGTGNVEFYLEADKYKLQNSADFLRLDYEFMPVIDVEDPESFTRSGKLSPRPSKKAEPYTHRRSSERLLESLLKLHRDYKPSALVLATEAFMKERDTTFEGRTEDTERMLYHTHHLQALAEAVDTQVPVNTYLWTSLLDSPKKGNGILAVDEGENRTLKDSAYWLTALIETRDPHWESGVDYKGMD